MAMTVLLIYAIIAGLQVKEYSAGKWNLLFILCLLAFTLRVQINAQWPQAAHFFNTFEYMTPLLFMLCTRANFDDEFELGRVEWTLFSLLTILLIVFLLSPPNQFPLDGLIVRTQLTLQYAVATLCVLWAYWQTYKSWSIDLVAMRRKARFLFTFLAGPSLLLGIGLYYASVYDLSLVPYIDLLMSTSITVLGLLGVGLFGRFSFNSGRSVQPTQQIKREVADNDIAEHDQALIDKLSDAMLVDQRFSECDLNIGKLASYLSVSEYKLRNCINKVLGYKNFNAYLNEYRIAAAKDALSDTKNERSILHISLDCGYFNQSTFYKAFRNHVQLTPSEYRSRQLGVAKRL